MITDDQFAGLSAQKLLSIYDFKNGILNYFKDGLAELLIKIYSEDGTFGNTRINIESVANDTFRLDSNRDGVTANGHLLANDDVDVNYAFQNTNTQTYYVGMFYGEIPVGVSSNPETNLPEYTNFEESIGLVAEPDDVIDNGGTITFQVDSVTESGVTNAGRSVRVWKKVPNSSTFSVAVEIATVSWSGTANVITTTGTLGQSSVSTIENDYYVQLVGPNISRNTDLRNEDCWFIGIITGNGPTAIPSSFDMSDQNLIELSLSEAFDSTIYAIDDTNFHDSPADDSTSGGIGSPLSYVQETLEAIDLALVMRRMGITLADGGDRDLADYVGQNSIDQINTIGNGGYYFLQRASNGFIPTGNIGDITEDPEVVGEIATGGHDGYSEVGLSSPSNYVNLQGLFRRLYFRSADSSYKFTIGGDGSRGETIIEQCGFDALIFNGFDANTRPIIIRDVEIAPDASPTGSYYYYNLFLRGDVGKYPYIIFQNCVIRGSHADITYENGAIINIAIFGNSSDNDKLQAYSRRIVFQDCQIIHENNVNIPTISLSYNYNQIIEFNRCKIIGITGQTKPVIFASASSATHKLIMRDCIIEAPSGQAISFYDIDGYLENVTVYSGDDLTVSYPQLINIGAYNSEDLFDIKNLKVFVGASAVRNGIGGTYLATIYISGQINIDGLYIKLLTTTSDGYLLHLIGSESKSSEFRNISVDFSSFDFPIGSQVDYTCISIEGNENSKVEVENLNVFGLSEPQITDIYHNFLSFDYAIIKNVAIHKSAGDGSFGWLRIIGIYNSEIEFLKVYSTSSYVFRCINEFIYISDSIVKNIDLTDLYFVDWGFFSNDYIKISNSDYCILENILFPGEDIFNLSSGGIYLFTNCYNVTIRNCIFNIGANVIGAEFINTGGSGNIRSIIENNIFVAAMDTINYIKASADMASIKNNILESTNTTIPTISSTGSNSITTDNIIVNA